MILHNYKTKPGQICIMSSMRDILNYNGFDVQENMVFVASLANMFYYKKINIDQDDKLLFGGIDYDVIANLLNIAKFFNLKVYNNSKTNKKDIIEFIEMNINMDRPVLAILTRSNLEYINPVLRDNIPHCVNVIGYESGWDTLYVSDTYIPVKPVTATYQGLLKMDNFLKSIECSRGINNENFQYNGLSYQVNQIKKIADFSIDELINPLIIVGKIYLESKKTKENFLVGMEALHCFCQDVISCLNKGNRHNVKILFKDIHNRLVDFGGPVTTYNYFSDYFNYMYKVYHNLIFNYLSHDFKYLSKRWFILANIICKYAVFPNEEKSNAIRNRMQEIVLLDEILWKKVVSITNLL